MGNSSGAVAKEEGNATAAAEQPVAPKALEETAPPSSGQAVKAAATTPVKTQNGDCALPAVSAIDGSATKIQAPPPTSAPPPVSLPPEPLPPAGAPIVPGADSPGDDSRLTVSPGKRYVQPPPPVALNESDSSSEEDPDRPKPELILGPDGLPSVGSSGHDTGECKRCCFFAKNRCSNGHDCRFCHFDHAPRKRVKKKKDRGSEAATPNGTAGSVMADLGIAASPPPVASPPLASPPPLLASPTPMGAFSTPLGRQGLPLSPMPTRIPLTPVTPTAPPMAPPTLTKLNLEEALPPPPPPSSAPALPESPAENAPATSARDMQQAVPEISITNADAVQAASKAPPVEGPDAPSSGAEGKEPDVKAKPASMEVSPAVTPKAQPVATPHGAKPTPVTLNDLLAPAAGQCKTLDGMSGSPLATVPNGNGCVVHSKDAPRPPRPLLAGGGPDQWPMGYWNPWPYYGDQPAVPLAAPQALPRGPPPPATPRMPIPPPYAGLPTAPVPVAGAPPGPPLAYGAHPSRPSPVRPPGAPLPVPHPTVLPSGTSAPTTVAPTGGMEGDSPRSVLLTLCGAWGALKTGKEDGKEEGDASGGISRSKMLALRNAAGDEERPAALKTFKAKNLARDMQ
mmetsp:Transcript_20298/g.36867  ORF Transcript_20298/g.36867 Transcript_20298/m.36867 type:complete len:624 (+) Transcript_20298:126-1997(+)